MRTYTLTLLGGVSLRTDTATLTGPAVQRHRLALLALLAAQPGRAVPRERLMALLWPERDAASARRLLNLSVHVLRRALGATALRSVPGGLALDPSALSCDVWTFEQALADGDTELAVAAYGGPFLEGFHLPDTVDFDRWVDAERDRLARRRRASLETVARTRRERGDLAGAIDAWRRLVDADPYDAGAVAGLMGALAAGGGRGAALAQASAYAARVAEDLGAAPAPAVETLARALRAAPVVRLGVPAFDVIGAGLDPTIGTALAAALAARLATERRLTVLAPGPAALGSAEAMVRGTLRRTGETVVLDVRLVESGAVRWMDCWQWEIGPRRGVPGDVPSADMPVDEIAAAVVRAARRVVLGEVESAAPAGGDALDEAAALCVEGRVLWGLRSEAGLRGALRAFRAARRIAPVYVPSWLGVADTYAVMGFYDFAPPRHAFARAQGAAYAALALDPRHAESYVSLGYIRTYYDWRFAAAERSFRRAVNLAPRYPVLHQWYGNLLIMRGRFDEAIAAMERSRGLAPGSAIAHAALGWAHYVAGASDLAVEHCEAAIALDARLPASHLWLGQAHAQRRRWEEAIAALERAQACSPGSAALAVELAAVRVRAGDRDAGLALLQRVGDESAGEAYVPAYEMAKLTLGLGDRPATHRWLRRARRQRSHSIAFLGVDPELAELR